MNLSTTCPAPAAASIGIAPQSFAAALNFFAAATCLLDQNWPVDADIIDGEQFDFIIVGAGSAGAVVANRLSEVTDWNILLVEAGGDPPLESIIPNLYSTVAGTEYDWNYHTVDNGRTNQANLNGNFPLTRGKMLGGCSGVNYIVYLRGHPHDYQEWYDEGNEEWHPELLTPYFKKAECLQNQEMLDNPAVAKKYGKTGPIVINRFNNSYGDLSNNVLKSWNEIGFKNVPDLNAANNLGSGYFTTNAADGQRKSTATSYLNSIENRSNIKVLKHAFVTKVLVNESVAYGIEVVKNNKTYILLASKEVVLSAGSVNTPKLLLLSGIGPKEHLAENNISCLVDSPMVGQNLQDHPNVPVTIYGNQPGPEEVDRYFDAIRYLYDRSGYLAAPLFLNIAALYSNGESFAKYQNFMTVSFKNSSVGRDWAKSFFKQVMSESIIQQNEEQTLFLVNVVLLHPHSRGSITLNSSDPYDPPLINANFFDDDRDLDSIVNGIKKFTKIVNTEYFKSINGSVGRMSWPECDDFELDSEDYWRCISLNTVFSTYHPAGTAKMGRDINMSVVSSRLLVHGVESLRVIDASVMPTLTSSNTNAPTIMIGERGSDLIKEDYGELCY